MGREIDIGATDGDAMQNAVPVFRTRGYRADRRRCCASGDRGGGFGTGGSEEGDRWGGGPCGLHGNTRMEGSSRERAQLRAPARPPQSVLVDPPPTLTRLRQAVHGIYTRAE